MADLVLCRLGSWQFLTELPYEAASSQAIWRLLWLMHKGCCQFIAEDIDDRQAADLIPTELDVEQCRQLLNGIYFISLPASCIDGDSIKVQ